MPKVTRRTMKHPEFSVRWFLRLLIDWQTIMVWILLSAKFTNLQLIWILNRLLTSVLESWSFLRNQCNCHQILRWWPWSMIMRGWGATQHYQSVCFVPHYCWFSLQLDHKVCVIKIIVLFLLMHHGSLFKALLFLIFWFKVNIIQKFR